MIPPVHWTLVQWGSSPRNQDCPLITWDCADEYPRLRPQIRNKTAGAEARTTTGHVGNRYSVAIADAEVSKSSWCLNDLHDTDKENPRKTPGEDPRARRAMTENGFCVIYALLSRSYSSSTGPCRGGASDGRVATA